MTWAICQVYLRAASGNLGIVTLNAWSHIAQKTEITLKGFPQNS